MTTRRERLEAKIDKRAEWADKARARSAATYTASRTIADGIPLGQPILVGHHSEGRHRRDIARIDNNMRKACEASDLADHHAAKAEGLAAQLDNSIFSDDVGAVAALEARIAEREAEREKMKAINKAFKKGDRATLATYGLDLDRLTAQVAGNYSWDKQPYASYTLTNLGATIRRDKERLEQVKRQQARAEKAEAAGGVVVEGTGDYVRVTFAEKPSRDVLDQLRGAGFRWGGGSWTGRRDALPKGVA